MSSVNAISMSSWLSSQGTPAPANINPNSWVVAVKLQNGQMKYLQFATQAQAQQDIQKHNFGVLISPQNATAAAASSAASAAPATPQGYVSPLPGIPYATWLSSRSMAPTTAIQPNLWTVEIAPLKKWVQFRTEQEADRDIQSHGAGTKIAPAGIQPKTVATYVPIPVASNAAPARPAQPQAPTQPQAAANQPTPAATLGGVKVASLQASPNNRISRGNLTATATAIPGGCRLTVTTHHGNTNDRMDYQLFIQKGGMWAQAGSLAQNVVINGYEGIITFEIDYAALSSATKTQITSGLNAEINGMWQTGHTWGRNSGQRPGGAFTFP